MKFYIMLLTAVILRAVQFAENKFYQSKNGSGMRESLLYTALAGLFCALILFCLNGFGLEITGFSLLAAFGVASLCLTYTLLGFRIFSLGDYSVYMMFLMLGGMILPFVWGMIRLGDASELSMVSLICRFSGVALLIFSLALPAVGPKKKGGGLFYALCVIVFAANGFVSVISKLHQIETVRPTVDSFSFAILTNLISGLLSAAVLVCVCLKTGKKPELKGFGVGKLLPLAASYGALNGIAYILQLLAASELPASVQYPMVTGGTVVLSALVGRFVFKEKSSRIGVISTLTAFAATFLFLF